MEKRNIQENKHFEISSDNKKYSLDIILENNKITLQAISTNSLNKEIYENTFTLSQIQNNKYFKISDNINEAFLLLCELIMEDLKKNIIITVSINNLNIILPINNPLVKEINFQLKQREKKIEEKLFELYDLIEKQQLEINALKNEIQDLKDSKNKKTIEEEEEKSLLNNSLIINNDQTKDKAIREWINPYKKLGFKLIFRLTRDGFNCSDFHRCCDNKGETLLLFKTDKNYKFGGYTPLNWVSPPSSGEVNNPNDNATFLFSLNKMIKYTKIKEKGNTLRAQKEFGPLLGDGTDLGINQDMRTGWSNNGTFLRNRELTDGGKDFNISEIEIFQVLNNN